MHGFAGHDAGSSVAAAIFGVLFCSSSMESALPSSGCRARKARVSSLVLKLFMNVHKPGAPRAGGASPDYLTYGVVIDSISVNPSSVLRTIEIVRAAERDSGGGRRATG